jgi:hypothetical protein
MGKLSTYSKHTWFQFTKRYYELFSAILLHFFDVSLQKNCNSNFWTYQNNKNKFLSQLPDPSILLNYGRVSSLCKLYVYSLSCPSGFSFRQFDIILYWNFSFVKRLNSYLCVLHIFPSQQHNVNETFGKRQSIEPS